MIKRIKKTISIILIVALLINSNVVLFAQGIPYMNYGKGGELGVKDRGEITNLVMWEIEGESKGRAIKEGFKGVFYGYDGRTFTEILTEIERGNEGAKKKLDLGLLRTVTDV